MKLSLALLKKLCYNVFNELTSLDKGSGILLVRLYVMQLAEHAAVNRVVVGSSPTRGATKALKLLSFRAFLFF